MSSSNLADLVQKLKVPDRTLEAFEGDQDIFEALSMKRRKLSELIAAEAELPPQTREPEWHGTWSTGDEEREWWHGAWSASDEGEHEWWHGAWSASDEGEHEWWHGDGAAWAADKPSEKAGPPTAWNVVPPGAASSSAEGATGAIGSGTKVVAVTSLSDKDSDSDGEKGPGHVTFDGASGASQLGPDIFHCCDCKAGYAMITDLAYLRDDNSPVVEQGGNDRMARVIAQQNGAPLPWKNAAVKAKDESSRLVCLHCCGRYHGEQYLQKNGKPTSAWNRLRKRSFGSFKNCPSAVKMLCELHDRKLQDIGKVPSRSSADVYKELKNSDDLKKGIDWITMCGSILMLFYTCGVCGFGPVMSSSWHRCISWAKAAVEGMTSQHGFWVCANCGEKWSWRGHGHVRLFTVGDARSIADGEYMFARIGHNVSAANEKLINFMKACVLLDKLHDRPLSAHNIIKVIRELNVAVEKKLMCGVRELVSFQAKPLANDHWQLYCESSKLSIKKEGSWHTAIDTNAVAGGVRTLDEKYLEMFLQTAAASLDVEMASPVEPAMKESRAMLLTSSTFQRARERLALVNSEAVPHVHRAPPTTGPAAAAAEYEEV